MNLGIASCRSFYFSDSWKASYFDLIRFMMSLHLPSGRWVWSVTWCETGQLEPGHLAPVPNQGSEKGEATCAASGSRRRSMHDSQATVVGDSLCCSLIFFFFHKYSLFSPSAHFSVTLGEMGNTKSRVCFSKAKHTGDKVWGRGRALEDIRGQ